VDTSWTLPGRIIQSALSQDNLKRCSLLKVLHVVESPGEFNGVVEILIEFWQRRQKSRKRTFYHVNP